MFLQLRFSRDAARLRGAPGQTTTGGPSAHQADGPTGPHRGCGGRRGGVQAALISSQASSRFPATWSPELPHTNELMQTLRERAAVNGETVTGADLTGKRKHGLHRPPHSFGLAFVVAPAATTGREFSSA